MIDTEVIEQLHNAAALVTWTMGPEEPALDHAVDHALNELSGGDRSATVAAFTAVTTGLLSRLAEATGLTREELWRETILDISTRLTGQGDHHG